MFIRPIPCFLFALTLAACGVPDTPTNHMNTPDTDTVSTAIAPSTADAQMRAVLDELAALDGKPVPTLTAQEAREQPTPADAVKEVLKKLGKDTAPEPVGKVEDRTFNGPGGAVPMRIYWPQGEGPFPVILYIHGGGWVFADLDVYDSSPRALCNAANAVVVSTHYRQGPEHPYPAAHEDTYAAYKWVLMHAKEIKGDPQRIALVGESAGGNMAASICLRAKEDGMAMPVYQVLVYPVTNNEPGTPSMKENADAKPLSTPMLPWFFKNYVPDPKAVDLKWLTLLKDDVHGMPPTRIILARIDPLRSEGEAFVEHLHQAGVAVDMKLYEGVTHEFFGMGAVVDKAKDAVRFAADGLKNAFNKK